jgi:hypothetical protein
MQVVHKHTHLRLSVEGQLVTSFFFHAAKCGTSKGHGLQGDLMELFSQAGLNFDPPNLSLPSS